MFAEALPAALAVLAEASSRQAAVALVYRTHTGAGGDGDDGDDDDDDDGGGAGGGGGAGADESGLTAACQLLHDLVASVDLKVRPYLPPYLIPI